MTIFGAVLSLLISSSALLVGVLGGPVVSKKPGAEDIVWGNCIWVGDRQCPDNDVKFYLFTSKNPNDRQAIYASDSPNKSNLSTSNFDYELPTKVIMHGFNSDMYLSSLIDMKDEYLQRGEYNIFYVDYSDLARGPCYVQAVHNLRHVGRCLGVLLDLIMDTGAKDIHLIGFSLGAQLANFASIAIRPKVLDRISGLDPAMPLYVGVPNDSKLDPSDAKFVDVYHTNALIQGKVEQCGTVDFYFNGGILQPGCTSWRDNPAGCSHNRAPMYFMESIRTPVGFFAWPCPSYIMYLLRMCSARGRPLFLAGEDISLSTKGMLLLTTRSESPFAKGRNVIENTRFGQQSNDYMVPLKRRDPMMETIDQWGKLDGNFNNIDHFPTPLPQDPMDEWDYFGAEGPSHITHNNKYYYDHNGDENEEEEFSEGPFGIQVADVLHRKQPTYTRRRKPSHKFRVKSRPRNTTTSHSNDVHLIQKLWEDYNSAEGQSSVPHWRLKQIYKSDVDEVFLTQPHRVRRPLKKKASNHKVYSVKRLVLDDNDEFILTETGPSED